MQDGLRELGVMGGVRGGCGRAASGAAEVGGVQEYGSGLWRVAAGAWLGWSLCPNTFKVPSLSVIDSLVAWLIGLWLIVASQKTIFDG